MIRWHAIVVGAVAGGAAALAGCASTGPGPAARSGAPAAARSAVTPPSAGAHASPSVRPGGTADIGLSSEPAPFTGDTVPLTVQAWTGVGETQPVRVASATVDLGDGTTASVSGPCTGASLPPPGDGLVIKHVYRQPGALTARVTTAAVCGQAGEPNLEGSSDFLRVLPSAPAASASWPRCNQSQVEVTARGTGAALGHVGMLFTLRNTSSESCRLEGYADML